MRLERFLWGFCYLLIGLGFVSISWAYTTTSGGLGLRKPASGEAGWGATLNYNADQTAGLFDGSPMGISGASMVFPSNVKIGGAVTTPTAIGSGLPTLEMRGDSQTDRSGGIDFQTSDGSERVWIANSDSIFYINSVHAVPIVLYTNSVERMRIGTTGDVGIGTVSASALLDLDGQAGRGILEVDGNTGGCLKVNDTDNGGFTYCTALNGTLSCSTSAC